MGYRRGKEFSELTKQAALYRSQGFCEVTGEPLEPGFQFHHKLWLRWAADNVPEMAPFILKSLANCVVVNHGPHVEIHNTTTDEELWEIANELRILQPALIGLAFD